MSHVFQTPQAMSRRTVALGGIAGLHVLVVYMFATGLAIKLIPAPVPPINASMSEVPRDIPTVPPPPPPTLQNFHEIDSRVPTAIVDPPAGEAGITVVPTAPVPITPPIVERVAPPPVRALGPNHLPNTEDYYPADMRRQGIEGSTIVQACVDERGVLVEGSPTIEQSSGHARLDAGALNVARAGHYARSMQGTTAVRNCFLFKVGFQMK